MLELVGVSKRYGEVVALDDVSLTVEPGCVHGFVGRNGAGKTTTMRVALGLAVPDAGEVRWKGAAITPSNRRMIGYMPEERGLYPRMSARSQATHFARLSGLDKAAAAAAADRALAELGLGERSDEPVEQLSLGNQQRAQLAIALVASPEVFVLDEPFSGLDPVGIDALGGVLRTQVDAGAGVLFSSHQLELVERLCDVVTIIEAGRVLASGPIGELRRRHVGAEHLRVALDDATMAWADTLPGVEVVGRDRDTGEVRLSLADGTDDQTVLAAAVKAGRVRTFRRETPSLAELFRDVVAG